MAFDPAPFIAPPIGVASFLLTLKLLGVSLAWIIFGMITYANSGRNTFVPAGLLLGVTSLEGIAIYGFRWRFVSSEFPRGFCIAQAVVINFFETVIVSVALVLCLSTLMAVINSDVKNIRSPFSFHPRVSPLVFVFPVISFGSWAGVVFGKYGSEAIGPSYIICDAVNPPYIKLLTYGAANCLVLIPASIASAVAAWKLNKRSPSQVSSTRSTAMSDLTTVSISLPPRSAQTTEAGDFRSSRRDTGATFKTEFSGEKTTTPTSASPFVMMDDSKGYRLYQPASYYPPNNISPTTSSSLPSSKASASNSISPTSSMSHTSSPPQSTVPSITQYILSVKGKDQMDFGGVVVKAKKCDPDQNRGRGGHDRQHSSCCGSGSGCGIGYLSSVGHEGIGGGGESYDTLSKEEKWVSRSPPDGSANANPSEAQDGTFPETAGPGELAMFPRSEVHFREVHKGGEKRGLKKISFQPAIIRMVFLSIAIICTQAVAMISPIMGVVKGQQTPGFQSQDLAAIMIGYIPLATWGFTPAVMGTCHEIWEWIGSVWTRMRDLCKTSFTRRPR